MYLGYNLIKIYPVVKSIGTIKAKAAITIEPIAEINAFLIRTHIHITSYISISLEFVFQKILFDRYPM